MRVTTLVRPGKPWGVQLAGSATGGIAKGDVCLFTFWIRGLHSEDELLGDAVAHAYVQRSETPYEKVARMPVRATPVWRRVFVPFVAKIDLPAGQVGVAFHLGQCPQAVEIASVGLIDYGKGLRLGDLPRTRMTYRGREPDAAWRRAAAERIEKFRKARLAVRVVDGDGQPVRDANVRVRMKRHAFGFGSAVRAVHLCDDSADGRRYRRMVERNFNKVTLENALKPKWWTVAKSNSHPMFRMEWTQRALAWLNERNIEVRGHYCYQAPLPEHVVEKYRGRPQDLRADVFAHIEQKVAQIGRSVGEWDAVNHIVGWGPTLSTLLGGDAIYADVIKRTRQIAPHAELWVNEGPVLHSGARQYQYAKVVRYLIDHQAAPDGIGFMGHFRAMNSYTSFLTPPDRLYTVFEHLAEVIPNLQLTELDVRTSDDEQLQADYLRDVMTVAFSHKAFQAIVMWGFWEGGHWKPDAALYRKDWSIKPCGRAWEGLVLKQWWTDATGTTDRDGAFVCRGFLGDYQIAVTHRAATKTTSTALAAKGASVVVALEH